MDLICGAFFPSHVHLSSEFCNERTKVLKYDRNTHIERGFHIILKQQESRHPSHNALLDKNMESSFVFQSFNVKISTMAL